MSKHYLSRFSSSSSSSSSPSISSYLFSSFSLRLPAFLSLPLLCLSATLTLAGVATNAHAADSSAQAQLTHWEQAAGTPGNADRGMRLFTSTHGQEWSCASCHGKPPTQDGQHANTGKTIAPLAPAYNSKRFTVLAKSDKWFRRNCNDVLGRECTATEKADVLAYLINIK
jgi:cytochrome c553